ncbi:hypothetical protein [Streptomyces sp. NRRL F-5727]|uniref:hypothetical protein n=1 Tax=Streptomyces sp. NRRL F-5727 TaxID=1463871 RepID=UPI0004C694CE|nr:hypothetical protein [Streptomyces sp. NRRL F-5727]
MSTRLHLNSARSPRTPVGSAGEWAAFFDGSTELAAKDWPPLLWWAMFGPGDLAEARIADTEDAGTEAHAELLRDWGEATYPYLVVDHRTAVARLHARREALTGRIGARYAPVYEAFTALVDARFGPYVLVRTEALADGGGEGGVRGHFEETLADLDRLDAGRTVAGGRLDGLIADFRRWRHTDPVRLLSGVGPGWPDDDLRERLDAAGGGRSAAVGWTVAVLVLLGVVACAVLATTTSS